MKTVCRLNRKDVSSPRQLFQTLPMIAMTLGSKLLVDPTVTEEVDQARDGELCQIRGHLALGHVQSLARDHVQSLDHVRSLARVLVHAPARGLEAVVGQDEVVLGQGRGHVQEVDPRLGQSPDQDRSLVHDRDQSPVHDRDQAHVPQRGQGLDLHVQDLDPGHLQDLNQDQVMGVGMIVIKLVLLYITVLWWFILSIVILFSISFSPATACHPMVWSSVWH